MPAPIHPDDLDAAAHLLAAAFHDDPTYALLAPAAQRPAVLRTFWRHLTRHTRTLALYDDGLTAVALLQPTASPPWTAYLGRLTLPLRMGLRSHRILTALDRQLVPLITHDTLPDDVRWLITIAVHPDRQHRGRGSELLAHCLTSDAPWALLTSQPRNVRWYARFGFAPLAEQPLDEGPTSWLLLRPAQSPSR